MMKNELNIKNENGLQTCEETVKREKKKRKSIKFIMISVIVLVSLLGLFVAENLILLNYANKQLENKNYKLASKLYEYIVPLPFSYFNSLQENKEEAELMIVVEKEAVRAFVAALSESEYADLDKVEKVYTGRDSTLGAVYGWNTVVFVQNAGGNNKCSYYVSEEPIHLFNGVYFPYYNEEFELYVYGIGENYYYSRRWDVISNEYANGIASFGKQVDANYIKDLINEYLTTKDKNLVE